MIRALFSIALVVGLLIAVALYTPDVASAISAKWYYWLNPDGATMAERIRQKTERRIARQAYDEYGKQTYHNDDAGMVGANNKALGRIDAGVHAAYGGRPYSPPPAPVAAPQAAKPVPTPAPAPAPAPPANGTPTMSGVPNVGCSNPQIGNGPRATITIYNYRKQDVMVRAAQADGPGLEDVNNVPAGYNRPFMPAAGDTLLIFVGNKCIGGINPAGEASVYIQ